LYGTGLKRRRVKTSSQFDIWLLVRLLYVFDDFVVAGDSVASSTFGTMIHGTVGESEQLQRIFRIVWMCSDTD
jgi:hypothetical protein